MPGATEGTNIARIVVNEIDAARFDPLLERALAKNAATCLDNIVSKLDAVVCVFFSGPFDLCDCSFSLADLAR